MRLDDETTAMCLYSCRINIKSCPLFLFRMHKERCNGTKRLEVIDTSSLGLIFASICPNKQKQHCLQIAAIIGKQMHRQDAEGSCFYIPADSIILFFK